MRRVVLAGWVLWIAGCRAPERAATPTPQKPPRERPLPAKVDWTWVTASLALMAEEYGEGSEEPGQLEPRLPALSRLIDATVAELQAAQPREPELEDRLRKIQARLAGPIDYELSPDLTKVAQGIAARGPLLDLPVAAPSLDHGAQVFTVACAPCHGPDGSGGAEVAALMNPPPGDILHPQHSWRPTDLFLRITYGGMETAMPAFRDGLSPADRWDVVFFLFAKRWGACEAEVTPLSSSVLAVTSDYELAKRFKYRQIGCLRKRFAGP